VSDDVARGHVAALQTAERFESGDGSTIKVSETGRELHARIGAANTELIQRMWGDLPVEDLDTTGRVLATILARANAELANE
jgi:hypothetical protein